MGVPKRKKSKSKRDSRRATFKICAPNWVKCPQCGETKLSHHVCQHCGYYKGTEVVPPREEL